MNRDEIMNMQPGWDMDAVVAKKVMGIDDIRPNWGGKRFRPSTDIDAAWEVVEKLREENCKIVLEAKLIQGWYVHVKSDMGGNITGIYEFDTAPEAICKIALLSLIQEDTP